MLEFSSVLNPDPADLHLSITQLSEIVAYTHTAVCHITLLLLFIFTCISDFFCGNPALLQDADLREWNMLRQSVFPFLPYLSLES